MVECTVAILYFTCESDWFGIYYYYHWIFRAWSGFQETIVLILFFFFPFKMLLIFNPKQKFPMLCSQCTAHSLTTLCSAPDVDLSLFPQLFQVLYHECNYTLASPVSLFGMNSLYGAFWCLLSFWSTFSSSLCCRRTYLSNPHNNLFFG